MSLLVVVPGFGQPNADIKMEILTRNVELILQTFSGPVSLMIFNYGNIQTGFRFPGIPVVEHLEAGYLGEKLYKYVKPEIVTDNILILLDDVELKDGTNINRMLELQRSLDIDIISPSLEPIEDTHGFMITQYSNTLRILNGVELFCYLMNAKAYTKYHSMLDEKSAWLWGIDVCVNKVGLRTGIIDFMTMKHYFKNGSYSKAGAPNQWTELSYNLKKFGCAQSDFGVLIKTVDFSN